MAVDTTQPEYWLNWRFLLCALWVYSCMALAFFLIKKSDGAEPHLMNIQFQKKMQLQVPTSVGMLFPLACDATRPARSPSGLVMASTTSSSWYFGVSKWPSSKDGRERSGVVGQQVQVLGGIWTPTLCQKEAA
ncbi:hypothetical protein ZEAMMB73_Zm00001d044522 [Zea mays]|uniref:Uncharacterized protein n=1 Tax=Zea mays TaxID=4577 RepID=A0A1D6NMW2_MAIZE|nr:hypothetical protein ZEAMMB73_Zm00001d044522 [Zea mays]